MIIILILSIVFFFFGWQQMKKAKGLQQSHSIEVDKAEAALKELEKQKRKIKKETVQLSENKAKLIQEISKEKERTDKIYEEEKNRLLKLVQGCQEHADIAKEQYFNNLERYYEEREAEFSEKMNQLSTNYEQKQEELNKQLQENLKELEKIQASKQAAIAAQLKEQEIKEKLSFYCLCPKTTDINDIKTLEEVKTRLNNPRILSMLIWSTYFQKDMTALCNNVLGVRPIVGIYKITNQLNDKCYIGQSVDIAKRWKDHAKCGLGIDAPAGNKLYKEMQEIGIWNFSWELLEECSRADLNDKERLYIDLYKSKEYGYNTLKGVS